MDLRDWLEIVLEYLKVLAWPIVVTAMLLVFRRTIADFLKRVVKVEGAGISAELTEGAEAKARSLSRAPVAELMSTPASGSLRDPIATAAPAAPPDPPSPGTGRALTQEEYERDSNDFLHRHSRKWEEAYATDRVNAAWTSLVEKASELGRAMGMAWDDAQDITRVSNRLLASQRIGAETGDLIDELVKLHKSVTQDPRIQMTDAFAMNFVQTAEKISGLFDQLRVLLSP